MKIKKTILITMLCLLAFGLYGQSFRTKIMEFENPGSRRIMKTEKISQWYYRSLPEKTLKLNVEGVEKIELRSFDIEKLRKPQLTVIIGKNRKTYDLKVAGRLEGYYLYEDLQILVPEDTKSLEILCYPRSIYMRAFQMIEIVKKPKTAHLPNRELLAHAGMIDISHNSTTSEYYSFNPAQPFRFRFNNGKNGVIYIRARLTDRQAPVFSLYKDGEKIDTIEFGLTRTSKYSATGVRYLSIGKRLDLPENAGSSVYELRAESDHMFMARPVILKTR